MNKEIVILGTTDGDWMGMYVNGKIQIEGHTLSWRDVLDVLDIYWEYHESEEIDAIGLKTGRLPKFLPENLE